MASRFRVSSLNPYAAAYVPLPRPGLYNESETSKITAVDIESSDKTTTAFTKSTPMDKITTAFTKSTPMSQKETKQNQLPEPGKASSRDFKVQIPGKANGQTNEQYLDEAHEMDLAYLSVLFPGMSEQSLADVYALTGEDLDSTVEMMREFEVPAEFSPRLLLQTPVYEPPAEVVGVRLKEAISGEASGSSSSIASEYAI